MMTNNNKQLQFCFRWPANNKKSSSSPKDAFTRFVFPSEHVVVSPGQGPIETEQDRGEAERKCLQFIRENAEFEEAVEAAGGSGQPLDAMTRAGLSEAHM
jgi:hypothetical protein